MEVIVGAKENVYWVIISVGEMGLKNCTLGH